VDPRAGLDDVEKRKFLTLPGLELRPLGSPVAVPTTLSQFLCVVPDILAAFKSVNMNDLEKYIDASQ
jgi:hypothetical protein